MVYYELLLEASLNMPVAKALFLLDNAISLVGLLAAILYKPRQVRKEATVVKDSGAGKGWQESL